ncbi:hypothetical protein VPH35_001692 [Triticum aestivum]
MEVPGEVGAPCSKFVPLHSSDRRGMELPGEDGAPRSKFGCVLRGCQARRFARCSSSMSVRGSGTFGTHGISHMDLHGCDSLLNHFYAFNYSYHTTSLRFVFYRTWINNLQQYGIGKHKRRFDSRRSLFEVCQVILPELILNIMLELIFDEISRLCLNTI